MVAFDNIDCLLYIFCWERRLPACFDPTEIGVPVEALLFLVAMFLAQHLTVLALARRLSADLAKNLLGSVTGSTASAVETLEIRKSFGIL